MISLNGEKIKFGQFPNGEVNIDKKQLKENSNGNKLILKYENDADLFRLMLVRNTLRYSIDLHITYFPYSRMDRKSDEYAFTLYTVGQFIDWLDFDSITVYEPHSDVTPALLSACEIVSPIPKLLSWCYVKAGSPKYQVFYPDAGAQKRYSDVLRTHDELIGFKKRDFKTGRITELQVVGEKKSDAVIIVDDLCSKGGTFVLAAEKLKDIGFEKIYLVVAHCEKTIFEGKVFSSGLIDGVFTTDSILDDNQGEENLFVTPMIFIK